MSIQWSPSPPVFFLAVTVFLSWSLPAQTQAVSFTGTSTYVGSGAGPAGDWEIEFLLQNGAGDPSISEFTLFFPVEAASLTLVAAPTSWDWLLIEPDPLLLAMGFVDGLTLGLPLASGESLAGLRVGFTWSGTEAPTHVRWDIVDPVTFATLDTGFVALPEPGLGVLAFFALGAVARRRVERTRSLGAAR